MRGCKDAVHGDMQRMETACGCKGIWREDMRKLGRCVRGKDEMTCKRQQGVGGCKGANLPALGYGAAGDSTSPMYMASPKEKKR